MFTRALRMVVLVVVIGAGVLAPAAHAGPVTELTTQPTIAGSPDQLVMPYVVVTGATRLRTWLAERAVRAAGGTVVSSYPQLGVVVAYSASDEFAGRLRQANGIEAVGATRTATIPVGFFAARKDVRYTGPPAPNSDGVPAEGAGWDVSALGLNAAHKVTMGSRQVVVGVLDTGVDDTHPELAAAFDASRSASCLSGWADREYGAWRPTLDGHGTHVAGTIAAARNGTGVVGVAPGVRLASVKLAERDDNETAESMVCGFVWAAEHGFRVTNNSYRSIPWRYACDNQIDQAAIRAAVGRAVAYAQRRNVLVVASGGNAGIDLAHRIVDIESPTDSTPAHRDIDGNCIRLPHELPGVVGTGALDEKLVKVGFSNYAFDKITVAAPGVRVWSTWPGGQYRSLSGTSMASPHAAGVAALITSQHPRWSAQRVRDALYAGATPLPCPTQYPGAVCATRGNETSFYGHGLVNAVTAVGEGH